MTHIYDYTKKIKINAEDMRFSFLIFWNSLTVKSSLEHYSKLKMDSRVRSDSMRVNVGYISFKKWNFRYDLRIIITDNLSVNLDVGDFNYISDKGLGAGRWSRWRCGDRRDCVFSFVCGIPHFCTAPLWLPRPRKKQDWLETVYREHASKDQIL